MIAVVTSEGFQEHSNGEISFPKNVEGVIVSASWENPQDFKRRVDEYCNIQSDKYKNQAYKWDWASELS